MQDVEAAGEGVDLGRGRGRNGRVGVAEKHEDVPDAELRGEGDRVVEEGQVPAGAIGRRGDAKVCLFVVLVSFSRRYLGVRWKVRLAKEA